MKAEDKQRVLVEVVQRVMDRWGDDQTTVERAVFDTLYEERRRLETDPAGTPGQIQRYDRFYAEAKAAAPARLREILRELTGDFAGEVVGHFDPQIHALATRVLPPALNAMLNTLSPLRLLDSLSGGGGRLEEQVVVRGETDLLTSVAQRGTTVVCPTHSSNMDSILVAFALFRLGLPPYTYGAGLNLFSNRLMGYFMHNLGAYKVDRRKKAALYKDVLKVYAGCTMENHYHNLFFPGGTRSRSGAVEQRLKLGLLGMAQDAYVHNLMRDSERPDVFVVPCTINYQLVLEAETLIDDHLKEVGKSRYIIEDDEFSRPRRILDFVSRLFSLDSRVDVVFGHPLDVFGNRVDHGGRSLDPRDRPVDRRKYVEGPDGYVFDGQRDREYTRELARVMADAFHRDTVVKSVNLVSHAVFGLLQEHNPGMDLYRLLRTGGHLESFPLTEVYGHVQSLLDRLGGMGDRGTVRLDHGLRDRDIVAVVGDALAHLGTFHRRPALIRRGDRLFHEDRNLLLYYGNRLTGFADLET